MSPFLALWVLVTSTCEKIAEFCDPRTELGVVKPPLTSRPSGGLCLLSFLPQLSCPSSSRQLLSVVPDGLR